MADRDGGLSLVIDGVEVSAEPGELIIRAAERAGINIPRFCYHPRLRSVGMCRMCLVEVKGPRGFSLQPSCFISVSQGMEVLTSTEKVKKAQDGVLEYLLANHPLDCPVCDKGGECPLQDQTLAFGPGETRFVEEKRHWAKPIAISELVYLDRERCIQCDRCTRFAAEVAGDPLISFVGRSGSIEVGVFANYPFDSYFAGNTVQICPVGALTASPYRFKARPWDLSQVESTCTMCSLGCQMVVQFSQNEITRHLGLDSEEVNHSWLCDKGRFVFEAVNSDARVTMPQVRKGSDLIEVGWSEAISKVISAVKQALAGPGAESIAVIGGANLTNEDIYAWVKLAKGVIGTDSVDAQLGDGLLSDLFLKTTRASISDALEGKALLCFSGDVKEELPVLYLRIREAVLSGELKLAQFSSVANSLTPLCDLELNYLPGGAPQLIEAITAEVCTLELASLWQNFTDGAGIAQDGEGLVVLAGRGNCGESEESVSGALERLLVRYPKAKVLSGLRRGNTNGALDIGMSPGWLPGRRRLSQITPELTQRWVKIPTTTGSGTKETLRRMTRGEVEVLFLLGADPLADFPDRELSKKAFANAKMVVSIDSLVNESLLHSSVVLPAPMASERLGTTTNIEGRVSLNGQALVPPGLARQEWQIAEEVASALGQHMGFESVEDISAELAVVSPLHAGFAISSLVRAPEGVLLPLRRTKLAFNASRKTLDPMATPGIASVGEVRASQGITQEVEHVQSPGEMGNYSGGDDPALIDDVILADLREAVDSVAGEGEELLHVQRRLFDQGTRMKSSLHLGPLAKEPQVRLSSATAKDRGFQDGDLLSLRVGGSSSFTGRLSVDEQIPPGVVSVELSHGPGSVGELISSSYGALRVSMVRA